MMEIWWRLLYIALIGGFTWFIHASVGTYPPALPASEHRRRDTLIVLLLWSIAAFIPILRMYIITPWFNTQLPNRTLQELIYVPLLSIPYLLFPLYVSLKYIGLSVKDLGFNWKILSPNVAISAILFGFASGVVAYITNEAVIGITSLPAGVLILLLYNNDFLEEFYQRGVIQSILERSFGQRNAILWGGVLFGLTHVVFDINQLIRSQGVLFVIVAFILQTISGWLLGIVFMKTRSLWPGTICHYCANWLPSILVGIFS